MIVERRTYDQTLTAVIQAAHRYREAHGRYPTDAVLDGAYWDLGGGAKLLIVSANAWGVVLHSGEELGPHTVLLRNPEVDRDESWRLFTLSR